MAADAPARERRRRIAAYGVCRDATGRVLLVRAGATSNTPGYWLIPGGGIEHGEHPAIAVVREVAEETGLAVEVAALRDVVADVSRLRDRPVDLHHDRVIYDVTAVAGALRNEPEGTTDLACWVSEGELATLPLMPFTAEVFGLPWTPPAGHLAARSTVAPTAGTVPTARGPEPRVGPRGQRFSAYALATDPDGRILLARIAPGYPGAGRWHLPGGGTDFGEQPAAAVLRELAEETDQVGRVTGLLGVSHRHNPAAEGPEGYSIDWHTVRILYRIVVDGPTVPRVIEAGGSTAEAAWFTLEEAAGLVLSEVAAIALDGYQAGHRR